jgi:hypothetical protein
VSLVLVICVSPPKVGDKSETQEKKFSATRFPSTHLQISSSLALPLPTPVVPRPPTGRPGPSRGPPAPVAHQPSRPRSWPARLSRCRPGRAPGALALPRCLLSPAPPTQALLVRIWPESYPSCWYPPPVRVPVTVVSFG